MTQENQETKIQARGCIQLGDLLIFAFGSFIMFAKTSNLLGKFAPDDWFGLRPTDYGFAAAVLIEGFLVWRKFKMWLLPPKNFVEWGADLVTSFVPFALSIAAQIIDGYVTTGLINGMSEQQKTLITTIVAALVGIPLLLDLSKTAIDNAPAGIFDSIKTDSENALQSLFSWATTKTKKENTSVSPTPSKVVGQLKIKPSKNGEHKEEELDLNPN